VDEEGALALPSEQSADPRQRCLSTWRIPWPETASCVTSDCFAEVLPTHWPASTAQPRSAAPQSARQRTGSGGIPRILGGVTTRIR